MMGSEEALRALSGAQGTTLCPRRRNACQVSVRRMEQLWSMNVASCAEGLSVVFMARRVIARTLSSRYLQHALSTQRCTASRVRSLQIGY